LKPKLLCVGISKWAVWRNQWFVIWNYWLLMKLIASCRFTGCYGLWCKPFVKKSTAFGGVQVL
jgi:hypothetical protein